MCRKAKQTVAVVAVSTFFLVLPACSSQSSGSAGAGARAGPEIHDLALIDAKTGKIDRDFPDSNRGSEIGSIVSDRTDGWYIGGIFTQVGNSMRNGIAHLRRDGSVDDAFIPDTPNSNGQAVDRIFLRGNVLYAAGDFGVVALNARSGKLLWQTSTNGDPALNLVYRKEILYISGNFSQVDGVARTGIAALDARSGKLTSWKVRLSGFKGERVTVGAMSLAGGIVYFSGPFGRVDGIKRPGLAAVRASTGRPTGWTAKPANVVNSFESGIDSILVTHGQVLLGSTMGGLAALDARTGRALTWPRRLAGSAYAFALSGNTVYLGAADAGFTRAGGKPANSLASVVLPKGMFTNWRPNLGRCTLVGAIAVSGRKVLVGGSFSPQSC